ncbi:Tryptophan halogenase [Dyadobacter soli]|uniref:Tryptophan halogenase n=2 Tax=Dyadobacter soli TaxID=659014 RepID=A0A1G7WU83_9BACT|nr:Tryptophan halogenase [Dyadobacter soli]
MEEIRKYPFIRHKGIVRQSAEGLTLDPYNHDHNWEGYQFFREAFDKILLERAIAYGAEFQSGVVLKSIEFDRNSIASLSTNLGSFKADFFVDATGRSASLAKKLGIGYLVKSKPLFVHYGYVQTGGSDLFDSPQMIWDEAGWTWISQITENLISWNRLSPCNPKISKGWLPAQIANLNSAGPPKAADVTWRIANKISAENYFLLGDAAFVLDPVSSKGVLKAIMSGMMCGHLLAQLNPRTSNIDDIHRYYNNWVNEWFLRDLQVLRSVYDGRGVGI